MNEFIQFIKSLWLTVRSNKYFVAIEGGATGAALNYIYDEALSGHLDFSPAGRQKLAAFAIAGGVAALRGLYRPAPTTNN